MTNGYRELYEVPEYLAGRVTSAGKIYLKHYQIKLLAVFFLVVPVIGCQSEPPASESSSSGINVVELEDYETISSYEETTLANPNILRYYNASLFVYDAEKHQVLELDDRGSLVTEYGRRGQGPGEFQTVNNIFIIDSLLYVVDPAQFRISRFKLNGDLDTILNYGQGGPQAAIPPAPQAPFPQAKDITYKPAITLDGNVLLTAIQPGKSFNKLYSLINWEGDHISEIGNIPEGSSFQLDFDSYKADVADQKIPAYYRPYAFPVNDNADTGELYFIYNSFPKIAKYSTSGEELWETDIPETEELNSIATQFYEISEQMRGNGRIALENYVSGISSGKGHLYLALGKYSNFPNTLWIHQFNTEGELIQRYKLISEDVNLVPIFDIDFTGDRIFVVTEEAEIRVYYID